MTSKKFEKDERTTFIENQSYRYGYIVLNFGILINIIYRSFRLNEAPWDLFGLIFLGGLITTVHQYRYKIFTKKMDYKYSSINCNFGNCCCDCYVFCPKGKLII